MGLRGGLANLKRGFLLQRIPEKSASHLKARAVLVPELFSQCDKTVIKSSLASHNSLYNGCLVSTGVTNVSQS